MVNPPHRRILRYSFLRMPKSMRMRKDMFTPIQNRCAVRNREEEVQRCLQGNRAAWQTTNRKEGRSKYLHFPYHHQPLTHSLCHGHFIADQPVLVRAPVAESKPELKSIVALSASPTITSMLTKSLQASFFPNQHGLSASSGWQCDPTKSNCSPIAPLIAIYHCWNVRESISL